MWETRHRPLLSRRRFAARMGFFVLAAVLLDGVVLAVGTAGYHWLEGLSWLDAGLNAALVMTGNGPVHLPRSPEGKLFTIVDALLGVVLFAAVLAVLVTPVFHRMLHVFHSQEDSDQNEHSPSHPRNHPN